MDTLGITYALITIMAWGSWLVPSQNVKFPNEQAKTFFVAITTLALALIVTLIRGELGSLSSGIAWLPVLGGLIWSGGAYCAFLACNHIGLAKAFGLWAALNIIVSFIWGMVVYQQFLNSPLIIIVIAILGVVMAITGIILILFSGDQTDKAANTSGRKPLLGIIGAFGAGILWGTFYIPSSYVASTNDEISTWATVLPLAIGMVIGTSIQVLLSGKAPKLESKMEYVRAMSSGLLWGTGNFCMLLTVAAMGPGPGYTLAQLCVVVNALWGILYFKDPHPKSRAAMLTLIGVILASIAGMALGGLGTLESMYEILPASR